MYQYEYYTQKITIILEHVTSVYYTEGADTFDVYLTDSDEPDEMPAKFYDDFMDKLTAYFKTRNQ